jgi:hypothetical protein
MIERHALTGSQIVFPQSHLGVFIGSASGRAARTTSCLAILAGGTLGDLAVCDCFASRAINESLANQVLNQGEANVSKSEVEFQKFLLSSGKILVGVIGNAQRSDQN